MLILARKVNEAINIGDDIVVTVLSIDGGSVKLGVEAPPAVKLLRSEVYERIARANQAAAAAELSWFAAAGEQQIVPADEPSAASPFPRERPAVRVVRKTRKPLQGE